MSVEELRRQISNADIAQIDILLEAAFARKRELYPQWDIQYMALQRRLGRTKKDFGICIGNGKTVSGGI